MPFFDWLNGIVVKGSFRLSAPIVLVVFGAMFARVIQKTNISDAIIKKAAELSGDKPIALATLMTAATAFVFLGMSGLSAVIMIGSIVIPIMTSAGVEPIDAVILILLGMITGSALNFAGRQKPRWKSPLNKMREKNLFSSHAFFYAYFYAQI